MHVASPLCVYVYVSPQSRASARARSVTGHFTDVMARMMANGGRMALTCQSPMLAGRVYISTQIEGGESMQCQQTILFLFWGSSHLIQQKCFFLACVGVVNLQKKIWNCFHAILSQCCENCLQSIFISHHGLPSMSRLSISEIETHRRKRVKSKRGKTFGEGWINLRLLALRVF